MLHAKWQQQVLLVQLVALVCSLQAASAAALPFRVYGPCSADAGGMGLCRKDSNSRQTNRSDSVLPAAVTQQIPQQLLVDMRLPCTEPQNCKLNVDVVRQPDPPTGDDISSCSVLLMPWSAFPCAFDASKYSGVSGQPSDLCYTDNSTMPEELGAARLATNLTTDGYNNLFYGVMPPQLCGGVELPQVEALLLTVDFRLASGRQFDRTYSFQIGHAVAAFGTCSEPSRLIDADKTWSTRVDVSHLQPYMQAGMPTRFSLANVLSNTYNVPIWARVGLNVIFKQPQPSLGTTPHSQQQNVVRLLGSATPRVVPVLPTSLSVSSVKTMPDEVMPLVPAGPAGMEALSVIGGHGDRPAHWPNATFKLPKSMSNARNIYRAQLRVVPKGNGCEEFWAMNPSGASTNSTCGGYSTGEPYREVRAYINGQLAGFYPISYTMYTGGIDPRLWTAIVAVNTYSLPVYTFDLSPWLGVLNSDTSDDVSHTITVQVMGATGDDWVLANTLLLWRDAGGNAVSGSRPVMVASPSMSEDITSMCDGDNITYAGDCVLRLRKRTVVAGSLLKVGDVDYAAFVKYNMPEYLNTIAYNNIVGDATWRQVTLHEASWFMGHLENPSRPHKGEHGVGATTGDVIIPSNLHATLHSRMSARGVSSAITHAHTRFEWLNAGGIGDGIIFELSDNMTNVSPHIFDVPASSSARISTDDMNLVGQRQHYQRLTMMDVYNTSKPACVVPSFSTHVVNLSTTIANHARLSSCVQWQAACAFCSPELIINNLDVYTDVDKCQAAYDGGDLQVKGATQQT